MTGADLCELYSALWPVDGVSICGPDELLQQVLNVPAQPLVFLLQVKHLVHQQQHYPQRNVIIHLDTQTNNKERKKLQEKKGNETPTTRHNPQTHVVIKLSRDSTVFRVDVRLGEEWRHLGGKNKHWIVRGQRETNLSEQWWQRGGLWNIYTFTLIKKRKTKTALLSFIRMLRSCAMWWRYLEYGLFNVLTQSFWHAAHVIRDLGHALSQTVWQGFHRVGHVSHGAPQRIYKCVYLLGG